MRIVIRDELSSDRQAIDALHRAAFGGPFEAELIPRLRRNRLIATSLVAETEGAILGHILFSWLPVAIEGRTVRALALAPLAVSPDRQRQGIGSQLVLAGLEAARAAGGEAVIVLRHPDYYPRFGFSAALAAKLTSPFPGDAFMALELAPAALRGQCGTVTYPPAFSV